MESEGWCSLCYWNDIPLRRVPPDHRYSTPTIHAGKISPVTWHHRGRWVKKNATACSLRYWCGLRRTENTCGQRRMGVTFPPFARRRLTQLRTVYDLVTYSGRCAERPLIVFRICTVVLDEYDWINFMDCPPNLAPGPAKKNCAIIRSQSFAEIYIHKCCASPNSFFGVLMIFHPSDA